MSAATSRSKMRGSPRKPRADLTLPGDNILAPSALFETRFETALRLAMRPDLRNIGGVPATRAQQGEIAVGINAEFDRIVTLEPRFDATEPIPPAAQPVELTPLAAPVAPVEARSRPRWIVPAAIFAVGLIASGALGYFLYTTSSELTS